VTIIGGRWLKCPSLYGSCGGYPTSAAVQDIIGTLHLSLVTSDFYCTMIEFLI
jgi:hypothetical protein